MPTLKDKAIKELGYGMDMSDRKDIALFAFWISRRDDGSLTPTLLTMEEEPIKGELKERIIAFLREYAERLEKEGNT